MHNAPLLMRGDRRQGALMHVDDAAAAGIDDGDLVRVRSQHGEIELPAIADQGHRRRRDRRPARLGPQGHRRLAARQRRGGANVNRLMSSAPEDLEALAGMARLTGVPVRVDRVTEAP